MDDSPTRTPSANKNIFWLAAFLMAAGCHRTSETPPSAAPSTYVIYGAHIVSPERPRMLDESAVVVEGEDIAWVGPAQDLPAQWTESRRIDAAGRFIVPGYIDSHVHVGHVPLLADAHYETHPELAEAYFSQLPRSYLYFGFTTLIDLDLRDSSRERFHSAAAHPRLLGGGRGIRLFEGYGPSLMPEEIRYRIFPTWTYNEEQEQALPAGTDLQAHTPEALVADAAERGAVLVKTYHESGFGGVFDWPVPSAQTLRRLVRAAHNRGLPIALHATGLDGYLAGLEANVDILAHGLWHWPGDRLEPRPTEEVKAAVRALASRGIQVQPTTRVLAGERDTFTWELAEHRDLSHVLPAKLIDWLATEEGRWAQREMHELYERLRPDPERPSLDYLDAMNQRSQHMLALLREEGVTVLFGSDTPAAEGVGNPPGLNGHLEMLAWEAAGYTPTEILRALTLDNARAFALDEVLGSIEAGKRADFLVLQHDPRLRAANLAAIEQVIVRGEIYRRSQLSARNLRLEP